MLLQPVKEFMNGSEIKFRAEINPRRMSKFNDHETLLEHIGNELLQIWDNCRRYKFNIHIHSDFLSMANIIEKILQFGPISDCSNVFFAFTLLLCIDELFVNFESLENWLIRSHNYGANNSISKNHKEKKEKERILEIKTNGYISDDCNQILINNLKEVN